MIIDNMDDSIERNIKDEVIEMLKKGKKNEESGIEGKGREKDKKRMEGWDMKGKEIKKMEWGGRVKESKVKVLKLDNREKKILSKEILLIYGLKEGKVEMKELRKRNKNEIVLRRL